VSVKYTILYIKMSAHLT